MGQRMVNHMLCTSMETPSARRLMRSQSAYLPSALSPFWKSLDSRFAVTARLAASTSHIVKTPQIHRLKYAYSTQLFRSISSSAVLADHSACLTCAFTIRCTSQLTGTLSLQNYSGLILVLQVSVPVYRQSARADSQSAIYGNFSNFIRNDAILFGHHCELTGHYLVFLLPSK